MPVALRFGNRSSSPAKPVPPLTPSKHNISFWTQLRGDLKATAQIPLAKTVGKIGLMLCGAATFTYHMLQIEQKLDALRPQTDNTNLPPYSPEVDAIKNLEQSLYNTSISQLTSLGAHRRLLERQNALLACTQLGRFSTPTPEAITRCQQEVEASLSRP